MKKIGVTKMRILVSGFTPNYGGVESFIMNYYRIIKQLDPTFIIDLLAYTPEPAYCDEIRQMGGQVYSISSPKSQNHKSQLRQFFREHAHEYDVFWCNKCDLHDINFLREAKNFGIPKRILHAHNSRLNYEGLRNYYFGIQHMRHKGEVSHLATDFWTCSDWAAKWIFPSQVLNSQKVKFIPNAIRLESFTFNNEVRQAYRQQLALSGTVFGCVGRLNKIKNNSFALQVFYNIWKTNPDSNLLVVGTGELEEQLHMEANSLPCADRIFFLGMRHDVPQLLQAMDCYLMPSLFEGFPVATIEAQAAGLPVFAASDGITPQAQLTDLFHFLPLSIGPEGWAEQIMASDLTRKDRQQVLREKGFDIALAANHLLTELKK